jgi:hypothetical protein
MRQNLLFYTQSSEIQFTVDFYFLSVGPKFFKNIGGDSNFHASEGWIEATGTPKTPKY